MKRSAAVFYVSWSQLPHCQTCFLLQNWDRTLAVANIYRCFCNLRMKYSCFLFIKKKKKQSTDVNHQYDRNRRARLFLLDASISHGGVHRSSRRLKPSSSSSGSSSVYLIYVPQLKLSSSESPLIFFPSSCSLSFSQF